MCPHKADKTCSTSWDSKRENDSNSLWYRHLKYRKNTMKRCIWDYFGTGMYRQCTVSKPASSGLDVQVYRPLSPIIEKYKVIIGRVWYNDSQG